MSDRPIPKDPTSSLDLEAVKARVREWFETGGREQLERALAEGERASREFAEAARPRREDMERPCGPLKDWS